ncbi:DUF192 domain-containing protein [Rhodanobacter sp. C03]|uniref:DUF192 domain-containing protein n=1 Tax=Rhodanobacter sp. C03 TaxID=1945858 RepID=UPI0009CEAD03|nr:DUF192 domain-containing protein [Rhodanobacter sp. C03]OOG53802.1 hypothetical protein B0E48_16150 [Rhodanobacter sp. C03]
MRLILAPLLLLLASCTNATPTSHAAPTVQLHGQRFTVEFATDDASREHGLMMRSTLAADHGMLFVFPDTGPRGFWMKNTLIPLDILYFDADRRLVSMQLDVPPCEADPCSIYPSNAPARYVLELSSGTARRIGAKAGDELKITGDVGPAH